MLRGRSCSVLLSRLLCGQPTCQGALTSGALSKNLQMNITPPSTSFSHDPGCAVCQQQQQVWKLARQITCSAAAVSLQTGQAVSNTVVSGLPAVQDAAVMPSLQPGPCVPAVATTTGLCCKVPELSRATRQSAIPGAAQERGECSGSENIRTVCALSCSWLHPVPACQWAAVPHSWQHCGSILSSFQGYDSLELTREKLQDAITDQIPQKPVTIVEGTSYMLVILGAFTVSNAACEPCRAAAVFCRTISATLRACASPCTA